MHCLDSIKELNEESDLKINLKTSTLPVVRDKNVTNGKKKIELGAKSRKTPQPGQTIQLTKISVRRDGSTEDLLNNKVTNKTIPNGKDLV